jgi:signal transduction histidine kinase
MIPPTVTKIKELLEHVDPEIDKRLMRIFILAKQAVEFASDLLGFSESKMEERKAIDINRVIDEAVDYFSPDTLNIENYDRVDVSRTLSSEPIFCEINETPLVHIVRNVVTNAYHAMEPRTKGLLNIKTYVDAASIANMVFEDNGVGIKKEHLRQIFRSDFSTKSGLKRNGLGLWLVKTYLHRMGGNISVESEYGRGSVFTIRFPLSKQGDTNGN